MGRSSVSSTGQASSVTSRYPSENSCSSFLNVRKGPGWGLAALLTILLCSKLADGQQTSASANLLTPQDLAKAAHNPFEDFFKLPLESTTAFDLSPDRNAGEALNVTPVLPFRLSGDWDLIARPSWSLIYAPSPHEQFGLGDLQTSLFLTPHSADFWIWGVGPIFQFPTATDDLLGTGRLSAGPTAALIYSSGPWFNGILTYQLMSFAGDRDRESVSQTYLEPEVSYNFDTGWYVDSDPPITFNWTAESDNGWTIPMGADVGKAFEIGAHSFSLQIGSYDLVKRPEGAPQWLIRVQLRRCPRSC